MRFFLLSLLGLCMLGIVHAQECAPDPRPAIFTEDFGSGPNFGPPLEAGTTNFAYGSIQDGSYVLSNTSGLNGNFWHNGLDHTEGDTDGYMLVLNAADGPGIFYQRTFEDLCPNTNYVFSVYIANLVVPVGCIGVADRPDIRFTVIEPNSGNSQLIYDTGEIFYSSFLTWLEFSIVFQTQANQTSALVKLSNNAANFCGNDLAIDDVSFRLCNAAVEQTFDICELPGGSITVGGNTYTEAGSYLDIIPVPNSCNDTLVTTNLIGDTRVLPTREFTFCEGDTLEVDGLVFTSSISFVDTLAGPAPDCPFFQPYEVREQSVQTYSQEVSLCPGEGIAVGANFYTDAGTYVDFLSTTAGCDSIVTTTITNGGIAVSVSPSSVELEVGSTVQLMSTISMASDYTLSWQPAEAFSCTDCPNPVLSPDQSGTYTLLATDLVTGCTATANVIVEIPTCEKIFVPTAFSPNRDGINDFLSVFAESCFTDLISCRVFDRWGSLVYEAVDQPLANGFDGWDGRFRGKPASAGVYGYHIVLQRVDGTLIEKRGDTMLLR